MDEFDRLERNLTQPDPHLEQALAAPDTETPQAAFDAFAENEHRAELHFLPAHTTGHVAVDSETVQPSNNGNVIPLHRP